MPSQVDLNNELVAVISDLNKRIKRLESETEHIPTDYVETDDQNYTIISSDADISGVQTVLIDGISGSYSHLKLVLFARSENTAGWDNPYIQFNEDVAADYNYIYENYDGTDFGSDWQDYQTSISLGECPDETSEDGNYATLSIDIFNPSNTVIRHSIMGTSIVSWDITSSKTYKLGGTWYNREAITSITIGLATANFAAGSGYTLYGVKLS